MCEICQNWVRYIDTDSKFKSPDGIPLIPNHHPNCPHYNDSLMDVYKVTLGGISAYVELEGDAKATAGEGEGEMPTIEKVQIHREIFENLREFDGF